MNKVVNVNVGGIEVCAEASAPYHFEYHDAWGYYNCSTVTVRQYRWADNDPRTGSVQVVVAVLIASLGIDWPTPVYSGGAQAHRYILPMPLWVWDSPYSSSSSCLGYTVLYDDDATVRDISRYIMLCRAVPQCRSAEYSGTGRRDICLFVPISRRFFDVLASTVAQY